MDLNLNEVDSIISRHQNQKSSLISILQDIQSEFNYLPKEALINISKSLGIPLIDIISVATFFKAFSLKPRGKYYTTVCVGTACHVRGAPRILSEIQKNIKIEAGQTTEDKLFTLEAVNCLGACALGPIVVVNNEYYGNMSKRKSDQLLNELKKEEDQEK